MLFINVFIFANNRSLLCADSLLSEASHLCVVPVTMAPRARVDIGPTSRLLQVYFSIKRFQKGGRGELGRGDANL